MPKTPTTPIVNCSPLVGLKRQQARTTVQDLTRQGHTTWGIQKLLPHLSRDFIERWRVRQSPETLPGRGRKSFINLARKKAIYKSIKKQRFKSASRVRCRVVNPKTGKMVSTSTMARYMREAGGKASRMRKSFYLTDAHKAKRVEWAHKHRDNTFDNWVFTDETMIELNGIRRCNYLWHDQDESDCEERYISCPKKQTKIMVWGGISRTGRTSLHFHEENVTSKVYQECIKEAFLPAIGDPEYLGWPPGQPGHLQQDGASSHMSDVTVNYLQRKLPKGWTFDQRGQWPPNSPDLNPIEHLWAVLKDKVYEQHPVNEAELAEVVEKARCSIDQRFINFVGSSIQCRSDFDG